MRSGKSGTVILKKFDLRVNFNLFIRRQSVPPLLELVGEFNTPANPNIMP
jgi:hypothetical protein